MIEVMCYISLALSINVFDVVSAKGFLISDDKEEWVVDFTEFMKVYPQYRKYNNLVQTINSNECAYVRQDSKKK